MKLVYWMLGWSLIAAVASANADLPLNDLSLITDPVLLLQLEQNGLSLGEKIQPGSAIQTTRELSAGTRFNFITRQIETDLAQELARDPDLAVGMSKSHRLFDARWLHSASAHFELVGIANRMDRKPFAPEHCGEVRLVYRLAYSTVQNGKPVSSRLPMTLNVVYWAKEANSPASCAQLAARWALPAPLAQAPAPTAIAQWLVSSEGPLHPSRLPDSRLKSVEINLQLVRWPSAVATEFGGMARYLLRVFLPTADGRSFQLAPLENTPDVARLQSDQSLRAELVQWIAGNLAAIDAGTAQLPEKFLATRAETVTPGGFSRLSNRPFTKILSTAVPSATSRFDNLNYSGARFVRSSAGLLRRLDDMSCTGCHSARAIAGFHLVGKDRAGNFGPNSVQFPASSHLLRDLPRRRYYIKTLAQGQEPNPQRQLSEHSDERDRDYGAHCGLTNDPSFRDWTCASGLECQEIGTSTFDRNVGACLPPVRGPGDPCDLGIVKPGAAANTDQVTQTKEYSCSGSLKCQAARGGFPGGMCYGKCGLDHAGNWTCGEIAANKVTMPNGDRVTFNQCLGHLPFTECIAQAAAPRAMKSCDADNPCRDDYICARAGKEVGACIPPYFLFQFRVDGHPLNADGS